MRNGLAKLSAVFLALAGPIWAPQATQADVVVELFTSQGCSSCPPADALIGQLAKKEGVIALSLHVDYWDYLGWKDEFAQPRFTQRQRAYAHAAGSTMIYTPQMVIGGLDHLVGTRGMELSDLITRHSAATPPVALTASRAGDGVEIKAQSSRGGQMVVFLVEYSATETVDIKRGENAGRQITYHNVVKSWSKIADWNGAAPLVTAAKVGDGLSGAVIVQSGNSGRVLAAAKVK